MTSYLIPSYILFFLSMVAYVRLAPAVTTSTVNDLETQNKITLILNKVSDISDKIDTIYCGVTGECKGSSKPLDFPDERDDVPDEFKLPPFEQGAAYLPFHYYLYEEDGSGEFEESQSGEVDDFISFYLLPRNIPRMSEINVTFGHVANGDWTSEERCPGTSLIQSLQPLVGYNFSALPDPKSSDASNLQVHSPDWIYALRATCLNPSNSLEAPLYSVSGELPPDSVWLEKSACPPNSFVSALFVTPVQDSPIPIVNLGCSWNNSGDVFSSSSPDETELVAACPAGFAFCSMETMTSMEVKGILAVQLDCCPIYVD